MSEHSAQIYTVCQCIDHCFSFVMWCDDFAPYVDPEDMMGGLDRAFDIMSDATRLHSFLALRKLDDFLGGVAPKAGDLTAKALGVDAATLLTGVGGKFLTKVERESVNKSVAHLTEQLTLDPESEIELDSMLARLRPVLSLLVKELREFDADKKATQWLDQTDALVERANKIAARKAEDLKSRGLAVAAKT
jgi:hypothetical protein